MSLLDRLRATLQSTLSDNEELYALVAAEIEEGRISKGLWSKALAENDFDEKRARAAYMRLRVRQLLENWPEVQRLLQSLREKEEALKGVQKEIRESERLLEQASQYEKQKQSEMENKKLEMKRLEAVDVQRFWIFLWSYLILAVTAGVALLLWWTDMSAEFKDVGPVLLVLGYPLLGWVIGQAVLSVHPNRKAFRRLRWLSDTIKGTRTELQKLRKDVGLIREGLKDSEGSATQLERESSMIESTIRKHLDLAG